MLESNWLQMYIYVDCTYHGPDCRTEVTAATRCVAPPTLVAAVNSSFMWISACLRVFPLLSRIVAAARKSIGEICKNEQESITWWETCKSNKNQVFTSISHTAFSGLLPIKENNCSMRIVWGGLSLPSPSTRSCRTLEGVLRWVFLFLWNGKQNIKWHKIPSTFNRIIFNSILWIKACK